MTLVIHLLKLLNLLMLLQDVGDHLNTSLQSHKVIMEGSQCLANINFEV